ncbi:glycosyltransferase family 4 protein [Ornithinibacillus sp. BX22]|uniref:Glycosyltransferase family 4 protein n=1 Tax=Ornithinibacillus hominis TaxID=2763055 RepID=A0A923L5B8_9BACI|nr:glycosyltransferase family 4 protein [Ornithinibacillus hominis]MBC5636752.1 glycosyltransferase family 4 protein [Ornithinibacillus hominis]
MKILITTEWYAPTINGVVTSIVNLEKELNRLGHEVRILTLSDRNRSYRRDHVTYIRSISAGKIYPGVRVTFSKVNRYIEELEAWKPDVIHSQCEFSTFRIAKHIAKKCRIPIVHTYHTVYEDYTHYFSPNQKWGKRMVALFSKRVLNQASYVIAPTKKVYSILTGYGVHQPIEVVPTGIDLKRFNLQLSGDEKKRLREKHNIPIENKVLLSVGRLAKEKNLEEILTFVSNMRNDNLTLLIVGDGPYRSELENIASKLGITDKVIFVGMIPPEKVASYYQLGDVFVSASNSETQGLTYIEALANGLPALCRRDACLEDVIEDGKNGWQYDSFAQFQEILNSMLRDKDLYRKLSLHAKEGAIRKYSSVNFAETLERLYEHTIQNYLHAEEVSVSIK